MYDYFLGCLVDKKNTVKGTFITLDVANIGYLIEVTEKDFNRLQLNNNDKIKIFLHLSHKEDSMTLYGFCNKEARDIFQILLSVSGVGAKMALALLNEFDTCDLISFVINGDFKELTRAKGVGPKLAQKIILELKDKLIKTSVSITPKIELPNNNEHIEDTILVLKSLGYEEKEIQNAINKTNHLIHDKTNSEEILRNVLLALST